MENVNNEANTMNDMMNNIEESMKKIHSGDVVKGKVISVTDDEVLVNIGYISDGIITKSELSSENINPNELVKPEDEIYVYIVKVNDGEGNVVLSKKKADAIKAWDELAEIEEKNETLKVVIKEAVKGGVIAYIKGIRAFIPASHLSVKFIEKLDEFVGKELEVKMIEFDKEKNKVVLSRKVIEKEELEVKKEEVWNSLVKGQKREGVVRRLAKFGAFVDLGGVDGLVHLTELSWSRIKHPSEVVSEGDKVEVYVLDFDKESGKISLGLKDVKKNPWNVVSEKFNIEDVVEGKIVKVLNFGAFVEIAPGVEGLVHISQIAEERVNDPNDKLSVGDVVKVKILSIDNNKQKISLSIKEAIEKPVIDYSIYNDKEEPVTLGDLFKDKFKDLKF